MMNHIDPGKMREIVSIQAATNVPDEVGGFTETWTDLTGWSALRAEIEPLTGNEQIRALQAEATASHRVRVWALDGIKSTQHRIRRHRDGGIMEIVAPPAYTPDRTQMELLCEEIEVPA